MIDLEFMERVNKMMPPSLIQKLKKEDYEKSWNFRNKEKRNELFKNYSQTEKGQIANRRRSEVRRGREKELIATLTPGEFIEIKKFYMNRPEGCHVDHIIPISKGGLHVLSNLQYLSAEENRAKSDKLDWKTAANM